MFIFTIKNDELDLNYALWCFHQCGQQWAFICTFNQSIVEFWDHADAKCHE